MIGTFQVRVEVPDDIVRQLPDERQLVSPSQRGQLECPKPHKGRRHPAHHRTRLIRCVSTAQGITHVFRNVITDQHILTLCSIHILVAVSQVQKAQHCK